MFARPRAGRRPACIPIATRNLRGSRTLPRNDPRTATVLYAETVEGANRTLSQRVLAADGAG
jgi:hypothetical protein